LFPPDLFSGILHRPDLCPRILVGPDLSVLFHGPDLWSGILHNADPEQLTFGYGPQLTFAQEAATPASGEMSVQCDLKVQSARALSDKKRCWTTNLFYRD